MKKKNVLDILFVIGVFLGLTAGLLNTIFNDIY